MTNLNSSNNMINLNKLTNIELINEIYELRSQIQIIKDSANKAVNKLKDDVKCQLIDEFNKEKDELLDKIEQLIKEKEQAIQLYLDEQSKRLIMIIYDRLKSISSTLLSKVSNKLTNFFNKFKTNKQ